MKTRALCLLPIIPLLAGCTIMADDIKNPYAGFDADADVSSEASPYTLANTKAGARPGDEAMSCRQISAELSATMRPIQATGNQAAKSSQTYRDEVQKRGAYVGTRAAAQSVATGTAAAVAAAAGVPGSNVAAAAADQAFAAANAADDARWAKGQEGNQNKMLQDQQALVNHGQQMQSNPRIQRLMALGEAKNCNQ